MAEKQHLTETKEQKAEMFRKGQRKIGIAKVQIVIITKIVK